MEAAISAAIDSVPPPPVKLSYGTAGFRANHELLDGVFVRCGCLAAFRSLVLGQLAGNTACPIIGVMITASHNPIEDNGVKMVDPDGGMLEQRWEKVYIITHLVQYAGELATAAMDGASAVALFHNFAKTEEIPFPPLSSSPPPRIYLACDTRPSSMRLKECVRAGAAVFGAVIVDHGILTTPQLHHLVRFANFPRPGKEFESEEGYYRMLGQAYGDLLATNVTGVTSNIEGRGPLILDCANGVGGMKAKELAIHFKDLVAFELRNLGETEAELAKLNDEVGAEHAQKARLPPHGFSAAADAGKRCASVDGDADRLVYHYFDAAGKWHLVDGDKIACLAAVFLAEQIADLGWKITGEPSHPHHHAGSHATAPKPHAGTVSVGIVQTAYANGASTAYIRRTLGLPVVLAKTGVKFVHHAAQEYDIGVYFEANGHGTVLFNQSFLTALQDVDVATLTPKQHLAHRRVLAAAQLINQAVGDALSDAMFVEAVLTLKRWSIQDWDAIYADLPSRQAKLAIPDRNAIKTTDDETRIVSPAELQAAIDKLISGVDSGRAFVRPSGTENVVRVYAEASTQEAADALAQKVTDATRDMFPMP